jgi:hypothetical protein
MPLRFQPMRSQQHMLFLAAKPASLKPCTTLFKVSVPTREANFYSYLGRLEVNEIKAARWESAFQSIAQLIPKPPVIRIFFGSDDHWVLNELRDAFVSQYCDPSGPKGFGEKLDITARIDPSDDGDETSVVIPHDFSIREFFFFSSLLLLACFKYCFEFGG